MISLITWQVRLGLFFKHIFV